MIEETKIDLKCLKVDGGASANDFLMQFQSDISNCIVHRPEMIETTALGAAYLAGLAIGFWKSKEEIKNNWLLNKEFKPVIDDTQRYQLLTNWHKAIRLALLMERYLKRKEYRLLANNLYSYFIYSSTINILYIALIALFKMNIFNTNNNI